LQLRASRRAPGVDRVYVPGEPEAERRSEQVRNGCRLLEAVEVKLRALATDLDVAFPAELLRPRT
jgi:LDH2 family malate/lactate/ureidoglycolate dehydrogenase